MKKAPLLSVGTFGVHAVETGGIWSFSGMVPSEGIKRGGHKSEADAISEFVRWFREQDLEFQVVHVGDLRTDVWTQVMTAYKPKTLS